MKKSTLDKLIEQVINEDLPVKFKKTVRDRKQYDDVKDLNFRSQPIGIGNKAKQTDFIKRLKALIDNDGNNENFSIEDIKKQHQMTI